MAIRQPQVKAPQKDTLVLIDGNAILHRAYHALPPLTTRSGEMVNAVYGFATMLLRILNDLNPKCIAVSFDTSKSVFRHQEFIGYKANRKEMDQELVSQIQKVHDLVKAFNIPIYAVDGYEADDVIGSIAKQAAEQGEKVLIVTGDKDFMQLVDDEKIMLYMPTRGLSEAQIIGESEVIEKMGIKPEQIVDYKGLVGDPSDNYPGVPGIGPKTAIELLNRFGSVEEIYKNLDKIDSKVLAEKLTQGLESAVLSKKLAQILTDAPVEIKLEDCVSLDYDKETVIAFFKELGFRSLVNRISGEEDTEKKIGKKKDQRQQSLF
ncbi:MAG: 5'-3' exonuclease [Patescibacteria group bacterium]|jgi:DNA polymerase-1